MAKTALRELQDQIDAVRREAFAAGYAAAMQAVRELAQSPAPGAEAPTHLPRRRTRTSTQPAVPQRRRRQPRARAQATRARPAASARPQRGTNARLIEEVLRANAPRALHQVEIRSALQHDKAVAMTFTSIRHALGQLEQRQAVERIAADKTWRYVGASNVAE